MNFPLLNPFLFIQKDWEYKSKDFFKNRAFLRRLEDAHFTFAGSTNQGYYDKYFGLIDFPTLGILFLLECIGLFIIQNGSDCWDFAKYKFRPSFFHYTWYAIQIAVGGFFFYSFLALRHLLSGLLTGLSLPIIGLVHLGYKIKICIEKKEEKEKAKVRRVERLNNIPTIEDPDVVDDLLSRSISLIRASEQIVGINEFYRDPPFFRHRDNVDLYEESSDENVIPSQEETPPSKYNSDF